jgi:dihydrodipicolinate synthase/N-acetylneuraminate lyase
MPGGAIAKISSPATATDVAATGGPKLRSASCKANHNGQKLAITRSQQMKPLVADEIRGTWATILLPLRDDETIDYDKLDNLVQRLIDAKVSGIYTNGTAAEFLSQSEDEFDRISGIVSERCHAAHIPFQIGVSHASPAVSLSRLMRSLKWEPGAFQVILPDWQPPTNEEIIRFLLEMARAARGIGLVLYNPPHAKRQLQPNDFAELKQAVPALIGIKVLGGDEAWFSRMRAIAPPISIFVAGSRLATSWRMGAWGAYSDAACLNPRAAKAWEVQMNVDYDAACELESRIQTFIVQHIVPLLREQKFCNAAIDKALACIGGWADLNPRIRWPFRSVPDSEILRLRAICRQLLPEFVDSIE